MLDFYRKTVDDLVKEVEDYFEWSPVTPKDNIETIMYRAGQASVVAFIKSKLQDEDL